ncbi:MAG: hypothetical protein QNJ72_00955 [Pleurocapsa sp. MO_226.B13]|nr:hypothetical protein [Pleurocapsa sp. MO_226.B13]
MKLLLLRVLLQRRAKDEGFTLPMVIALGLVMILLGAVNITSANEENLNAIIKNSRSDALAIAEVGVARYRELLDKNRILALYDADTTTNSWANLPDSTTDFAEFCEGNIADFYPGTSNNVTISEDGQDLNNDSDTNDTFSTATDSFPTGSYSLVSYDYSNADGVFDMIDDSVNNNATGRLTVKGTTPDGDGEAQIQVDIPIRINLEDMNNIAPALWINNNAITAANLGTLDIDDGNLVIRDRALTATGSEADGCKDFSSLETADRTVISDPRDIPSIQQVITDVTNASNVAAGDQTNPIPTASGNEILFGTRNDDAYNPDVDPATFDPDNSSGDCSNIRLCRYYYDPNGINYTDIDLLTDGIANTTLLVNGSISITASTRDVNIGSTSSISSSDAFEIYVNGNNNITIDTGTGNTININAFIHAPNSTLTITGSGTVNINGSVWVNDFVNTTATVNITPDDSSINSTTSDKAYNFYTTTDSRTAKPLTGSPTNWKTGEVN